MVAIYWKWLGTYSLHVEVIAALAGVFFFSSRRRHTRFDCDWSSDVYSSDLISSCIPFIIVFTYEDCRTLPVSATRSLRSTSIDSFRSLATSPYGMLPIVPHRHRVHPHLLM